MILKRLLMSTPLFVGAAAISCHYLTTPSYGNVVDLFEDILVNSVIAVVVIALLSIAWRPSPFLKIVTVTAFVSVIGNAFVFPPLSFSFIMIAGALMQNSNVSDFIAIAFLFGIVSSGCALGSCLIFDATRFIPGINWRSYCMCAGLCFWAGVPMTLDAPVSFALHKFVWIVLLAVGLCITADESRDSADNQLVEDKC